MEMNDLSQKQPLSTKMKAKLPENETESNKNEDELQSAHGKFLKDIEEYTGDDPILPWIRYMNWVKKSYVDPKMRYELYPILEKCLLQIKGKEKYYNDIRFLKMWIHYAYFVKDPRYIFKYLEKKNIGKIYDLYYEAYAAALEHNEDYKKCLEIYKEGLARPDHGVKLKEKYEEFLNKIKIRKETKMNKSKQDSIKKNDEKECTNVYQKSNSNSIQNINNQSESNQGQREDNKLSKQKTYHEENIHFQTNKDLNMKLFNSKNVKIPIKSQVPISPLKIFIDNEFRKANKNEEKVEINHNNNQFSDNKDAFLCKNITTSDSMKSSDDFTSPSDAFELSLENKFGNFNSRSLFFDEQNKENKMKDDRKQSLNSIQLSSNHINVKEKEKESELKNEMMISTVPMERTEEKKENMLYDNRNVILTNIVIPLDTTTEMNNSECVNKDVKVVGINQNQTINMNISTHSKEVMNVNVEVKDNKNEEMKNEKNDKNGDKEDEKEKRKDEMIYENKEKEKDEMMDEDKVKVIEKDEVIDDEKGKEKDEMIHENKEKEIEKDEMIDKEREKEKEKNENIQYENSLTENVLNENVNNENILTENLLAENVIHISPNKSFDSDVENHNPMDSSEENEINSRNLNDSEVTKSVLQPVSKDRIEKLRIKIKNDNNENNDNNNNGESSDEEIIIEEENIIEDNSVEQNYIIHNHNFTHMNATNELSFESRTFMEINARKEESSTENSEDSFEVWQEFPSPEKLHSNSNSNLNLPAISNEEFSQQNNLECWNQDQHFYSCLLNDEKNTSYNSICNQENDMDVDHDKEMHSAELNNYIEEEFILNPWRISFLNKLLQDLNPPINEYDGYNDFHQIEFKQSSVIRRKRESNKMNLLRINEFVFDVYCRIGKGGFGEVYKIKQVFEIKNSNKLNLITDDGYLALKLQRVPRPWEYYISHQLKNRLEIDQKRFFNFGHEFFNFSNCSIMVSDFEDLGTLQDAINAYKVQGILMDEILCIFYTAEILHIVEILHSHRILHCDLKPDNLLIRYSKNNGESRIPPAPNASFWDRQGLKLIDWGKSIDLSLFSKNVKFLGDNKTNNFRCIPMMEEKPWKFQIDAFGICGIVHCLLHGSYLEIEKISPSDQKYKPKTSLKRYWNASLWTNLFDKLLNVQGCELDSRLLRELRSTFEDSILNNPKCLRTLRTCVDKHHNLLFAYQKTLKT